MKGERFRLPIFLRMALLEFATQSTIRVIALTFDGYPGNIAMCNELSADIYNQKENLSIL